MILFISALIVAGCSSGGSTGGGAGAANTGVTADGVVFSASVSPSDSISMDTITSQCAPAKVNPDTGEITPPEFEPGITTLLGTLTISAQSSGALVDSGLFPSGVTFNQYSVSYTPQSDSQAPRLSTRSHAQSITLINGTASVSANVILFDLGSTLREFSERNPNGNIYSYRIDLTANGQTLAGKAISVTASTFIEAGDFDRC